MSDELFDYGDGLSVEIEDDEEVPVNSQAATREPIVPTADDGFGLPQEAIDNYWDENPGNGVLDVTQAAFRKYNSLVSVAYRAVDEVQDYFHGDFNLSASLEESIKSGELKEEDVQYFRDCKGFGQFQRIKRELADNKLLDEASWHEVAIPRMMAGTLEYAIPVGGALKLSSGVAKAMINASCTALASAGIRYSSQELMSKEDVACEVVSAGVFSGILKGATKFVKSDTFKGWTKNLSDYFKTPVDETVVFAHDDGLYTGFVKNGKIVKSKVPKFVNDIIQNSPYLRGAMSNDPKFRDIMTSLLRSNNIITKETREGSTQIASAESAIDYTNNMWNGVKKAYENIYDKFLRSEFASKNNWKKEEFNLEVSRYIRNVQRTSKNSYEVNYEGPAEIKQAGDKILRFWNSLIEDASKNNVIARNYIGVNKKGVLAKDAVLIKEEASMLANEFKEKALLGELSDSKVTSFGHFSRIYDVEKIYANEEAFKELMLRSLFKNNPHWSEKQITDRLGEIMSHVTNTDVSTRFKLMGFDFKGNIGGKFTKPRSIAIADDVLEPFLVNNPLEVGDGLVRRLSTATELNRVAIAKGYDDWEGLLEGFSKKRNAEKVTHTLSAKESIAYDKQTQEYSKYLMDTADLLMGTYSKFDDPGFNKISSGVKAWNAMRHLGGVLVSSICDVSGVVSRFGLANTIKGAIDSFKKQGITNNQGWSKVLHASETSLASSKMFDDTYRQLGKPLGKWSKRFNKLTLLPYWNDYWKKVSATLHYSDILDACMKPNEKNSLFLRQHRISENMRKEILMQYKKFGYEHGGNYILPLDKIENKNISKTLYSALKTMADETVITVGAGDVPRFLRSGVGSALLQYRTFSYAYFNNIVVPQLVQSDSRNHTLEYLLTAAVLAPVVQVGKYIFKGDGDKIDLNDNHFWIGALRDSGILGHILDTAEFGVTLFKDPERAFSRISPAIGLGVDVVHAMKLSFKKGKATESQLRKLKGLVPFNNLFYYNGVLNEAIHRYSEETGRRLRK